MNRWTRLPLVVISILAIGVGGLTSASGAPPAGDGSVGVDKRADDQVDVGGGAQIQGNAPDVVVSSEFVPLPPCRIVDTRNAAAGRLQTGSNRSFYVSGTFGFAPQGGKAGGCGVPTGASAVAVTLIAVSPAGVGNVRAWAPGTPEPTATVLSYSTAPVTSVGTTLAIRQTAGTGIVMKAFNNSTHLTADVLGYYREPIAAWINASGTIAYKSGQVTSASTTGTGQYVVNFERNVGGCVIVSNATASFYNVGSYTSGSNAYFFVRDVTVAGSPYADSAFTFTVTC